MDAARGDEIENDLATVAPGEAEGEADALILHVMYSPSHHHALQHTQFRGGAEEE